MSSKFEREDSESKAPSINSAEHRLLGDLHQQGIHHATFYQEKRPDGSSLQPLLDRHGQPYPRLVNITTD